MGTLRFFEEVVSFKIRRTFGFADYRFAHCGQTRHGTANGRPCRAGTVIENNLTIGIFPFGGNGRTRGSGHAIRFPHVPRERSSGRIPSRNPRRRLAAPGISTRRIRCFSKTLLLLHRPASYGRIVIGVSKRISPLSLKHSALLIFLSHLIIIFVTRIVRRNRILRRDGENTAIRPVIERNFHPLYRIRTW